VKYIAKYTSKNFCKIYLKFFEICIDENEIEWYINLVAADKSNATRTLKT